MRLIGILRQRLRSMFRTRHLEDELEQELLFHLEQLEHENLQAGMSAEDARLAARRTLGNIAVLKDDVRDQRRMSWYYDFCQDVRYGLRMMRKHPGFTLIAAVALALGIGANTAILNVGATLFLQDLPMPDAERLVMVRTNSARSVFQTALATVPDYVAWSTNNRSFDAMGATLASQQDFSGDDGIAPERIDGQFATPSLFRTLRVQPQLGRVFRDDEVQGDSASPVVILSHPLWLRRFAGDSGIVGRRVQMNGRSTEVIGVMPDGFIFPNNNSDFWVPLAFTELQLRASARLFNVVGRLKPDATLKQAEADLDNISARSAHGRAEQDGSWHTRLVTLREFWFGWVRRPLLTLEGAVILVLLVACANVSTLLLARMPERHPEVVVRFLMGASRGRIVRQFLTESLLLSLLGGALGIPVAWWGVHSVAGLQPPLVGIAMSGMAQNNGIIGFAALLALATSLMFGLIPALVAFASGADVRQSTAHRRSGKLSGILVSAQVGLALVLLISSGLLLNSFVRLLMADRGFDANGVLTFEYRIPAQDYTHRTFSYRGMPAMDFSPPTKEMRRVYERLKALPGMESVAGSSARPVKGLLLPTATVILDGKPAPESPADRSAANINYFLVTDNFFETLKAPMVLGRDFDERDTRSTNWVAVINEAMAQRYWPGENPIGKRFTIEAASGEQPREVIGVVRDIAIRFIRTGPPQPVAYASYLQQPERYEGFGTGSFGHMTFFVRSAQPPSQLEAAARRAVGEIDPTHPLSDFQTLEEFLGESVKTRRYDVSAFGGFALMAMILAAVGVYGVMSAWVAQRAREIGIHMAMGASRRDVVKLIGKRALRLVALGLLFGLLASLAVTQLLASQLFGITPRDPATFIAVSALLAGVSVLACFFPARRAMRVAPAEALRLD